MRDSCGSDPERDRAWLRRGRGRVLPFRALWVLLIAVFGGVLGDGVGIEAEPALGFVVGEEGLETTEPVILAGGDDAYPPFEFQEEGGPKGFNVDLIREVANTMGLKVRIQLAPWAQVRQALEQGKIDLLIGMYFTPERARRVDFSQPHSVVSHAIFVRQGTKGIAGLNDLKGRKVLVEKGDVMQDRLVEAGLENTLVPVDNPAEALRHLSAGNGDAAVLGKLQGLYLAQVHRLTNIVTVGDPLFSQDYCFAVAKGKTTLLAQLDEGLAILRSTGRLREIQQRWFGHLEPELLWPRRLIPGLLALVALLGIGFAMVALWSRSLHRQVRLRTAELENRLTELRQMSQERAELEKQVQYSQKLESLGVLAGGIAHDFNNLLQPILGHAELALIDTPADSPLRQPLAEIIQASGRAAAIINQLLLFAGRKPGKVEPVDLAGLIDEISMLLRFSISKKAQLVTKLEPGLPPIAVDPTQVRQVLMNLIINASDALAEKGGTIEIAARLSSPNLNAGAASPRVLLEVADDGCGMDEATLARIFDPFFTTKFTGRGLGLAVVRGIVLAHQGELQVDSTPGQGTTFRVFWPLAGPEEPVHDSDQRLSEVGPTPLERGSGLVLVADDEEQIRELARQILEREGFRVVVAEDGERAVAQFQKHRKELIGVVLDLTMPKLSGSEALAKLRRVAPEVPVILASGFPTADFGAVEGDVRPDGFIHKPYRRPELLEALSKAISARQKPA